VAHAVRNGRVPGVAANHVDRHCDLPSSFVLADRRTLSQGP
jgi:hypothetical protein